MLDLNDKLRDILTEEDGVRVPTIAIIGNQSSGKSSVVERLSRVDLPRGAGIVTRCALVMRMKRLAKGQHAYAVISGGKYNKHKIELGEVNQFITEITDEVAPNKSISDKAIQLQVYSPDVADLTVVDLPGITYRNEETGDRGIFDQIKKLYLTYISDKNCIILVALPADQDVGTQQAYVIAEEVDPKQERTIGVITKIDRTEDAAADTLPYRLKGEGHNSWAFKLGAVAVRNRTLKELEDSIPYSDVERLEADYFTSHHTLSKMGAADREKCLGFPALVNKLVTLQYERIKAALPGIAKLVSAKLEEQEAKLAALPPACDSLDQCRSLFTTRMNALSETVKGMWNNDDDAVAAFRIVKAEEELHRVRVKARQEEQARLQAAREALGRAGDAGPGFGTAVDGTLLTCSAYDGELDEEEEAEEGAAAAKEDGEEEGVVPIDLPVRSKLRLAPRLQEFADAFERNVRASGQAIFTRGYRHAISVTLKEARGRGLPDSFGLTVTDKLIGAEMKLMKTPALQLLDDSHAYMCSLTQTLVQEHFSGYPSLQREVAGALNHLLSDSKAKCRDRIQETLDIEAEPYTLNHYYADTVAKVRAWMRQAKADGRMGRKADPKESEIALTDANADEFLDEVTLGGPHSHRFVMELASSDVSNFAQSVEDMQASRMRKLVLFAIESFEQLHITRLQKPMLPRLMRM